MAHSNHRDAYAGDDVQELLITNKIDALEINQGEQASCLHSPFLKLSLNSKRMRSELCINFPDVISTATCSELVVELIKYILYLKEQIPYQYNRLKLVVDKKTQWDLEKHNKTGSSNETVVPRCIALQAEKHFSKSSQAVASLEQTFKALRKEIAGATSIALLLGATIASPQETYVVELPPLFPVPAETAPSRGCLMHLLRELITCESLQKMTSRPSKPCNIHIMLKKPANEEDTWFELRPQFSLPTRCHQLSLKFQQPPTASDPNFTIYQDLEGLKCPSPTCKTMNPHEPRDCPLDTNQWFQAQQIVKGFKDCWIGDKCATDIWMQI